MIDALDRAIAILNLDYGETPEDQPPVEKDWPDLLTAEQICGLAHPCPLPPATVARGRSEWKPEQLDQWDAWMERCRAFESAIRRAVKNGSLPSEEAEYVWRARGRGGTDTYYTLPALAPQDVARWYAQNDETPPELLAAWIKETVERLKAPARDLRNAIPEEGVSRETVMRLLESEDKIRKMIEKESLKQSDRAKQPRRDKTLQQAIDTLANEEPRLSAKAAWERLQGILDEAGASPKVQEEGDDPCKWKMTYAKENGERGYMAFGSFQNALRTARSKQKSQQPRLS